MLGRSPGPAVDRGTSRPRRSLRSGPRRPRGARGMARAPTRARLPAARGRRAPRARARRLAELRRRRSGSRRSRSSRGSACAGSRCPRRATPSGCAASRIPRRSSGCRAPLAALAAPCVAIVGPRAPTAYGRVVARALARALASAGLVVVSGLARGVDAEAHEGALDAGGRTIAFQACGPERVYPAEHRRLAARIAASGAVVSELPPGTPPRAPHFPLRNRLISGLSLAVVVVEAREQSGTLVTARHAAEQGVDVLAVPGPIDAPTSRGTNRLLRDGAKPLLDVRDVLDAIGIRVQPPAAARAGRRAVRRPLAPRRRGAGRPRRGPLRPRRPVPAPRAAARGAGCGAPRAGARGARGRGPRRPAAAAARSLCTLSERRAPDRLRYLAAHGGAAARRARGRRGRRARGLRGGLPARAPRRAGDPLRDAPRAALAGAPRRRLRGARLQQLAAGERPRATPSAC